MSERAPRRTTDMPALQAPRRSINLALLAQRHATALRVAYLVCIGIATLLHPGFDPSIPHMLERLRRAYLPDLHFKDVVDAVRNLALFFGWGATYALTSRAPTTRRDVVTATLLGMLASLTVESVQLFAENRQASLVDVWTNTVGALGGALALAAVEHRAIGSMRRGTLIGVPGWLPAGALLLTAMGLTFAPSTRPTSIVGWYPSPFGRIRAALDTVQAQVPWPALAVDALAWIAVGLAVAMTISDRTGRVRTRQLLAWLVLAPGALLVTHLGRLAVGLQREASAPAVQGGALALGMLAGLLLVPVWRRRVTARSTRAAHLGVLAALVGAVMALTPAWWVLVGAGAPRFRWQQLVPMLSLFSRQDMSSVFLVLQRAGLGAAIGACLAARKRVGAPVPGLWSAVAYAAVLEGAQFLVPGRYPDITDVLITGAAAALVLALVERADRGPAESEAAPDMALNACPRTGRF